MDFQLLPSRQSSSTLLADCRRATSWTPSSSPCTAAPPTPSRADRSMDDRILTKVCEALGDDVTLGRIAAALRALMGEPDDAPAC